MASPRGLLRAFLVERFSTTTALRLLVTDHFAEVTAEVPWQAELELQAEAFIAAVYDRGGMDRVWSALIEKRPALADEIRKIQEAWAAGAAGNAPAPSITRSSTKVPALIDRERIAEIFRVARAANLDDVRAALYAGLPGDLFTQQAVRRLNGQLLLDLHQLSCAPGDPPPLLLWLENAALLVEGDPASAAFKRFVEQLTAAPAPTAAPEPTAIEQSEQKVTNSLEAIILGSSRPAIAVENGTLANVPEPWNEELELKRAIVERAIAATGRVDAPDDANIPWLGTGVVVGEDLVAVLQFDDKPLPRMVFVPRQADEQSVVSLEVTDRVYRSAAWDIAFLRVPRLREIGIEPLKLAVKAPPVDSSVIRVTYVGKDARVDQKLQAQMFGHRPEGSKWVMPGKVTRLPKARKKPDGYPPPESLLEFDTNTLGGTGGPLVSLETGEVVGLARQRSYLRGNWAVPSWILARDPEIRKLGVNFA